MQLERRRPRFHALSVVNTPSPIIVEAPCDVEPPTNDGTSCPKCGKPLKRQGAHFHVRACKGKT